MTSTTLATSTTTIPITDMIGGASFSASVSKSVYTSHTASAHHRLLTEKNSDAASGPECSSDEDVLHVVTNVYTIPIIKQSSSSAATTSDSAIPIALGEPRVRSSSNETRTVIKRISDPNATNETNASSASSQAEQVTKSKFQIRSIVEIYENQDESQQAAKDVAYFNSNTQFNETITKEVVPQPQPEASKGSLENSLNLLSLLLIFCLFTLLLLCVDTALICFHTTLRFEI